VGEIFSFSRIFVTGFSFASERLGTLRLAVKIAAIACKTDPRRFSRLRSSLRKRSSQF
jgi:hypothetical protein